MRFGVYADSDEKGGGMSRKQGRAMLLLYFLGILLAFGMYCLPLYSFHASVYTRKSANTFVGDEKYLETRKEVEETAEEYQRQGLDVKISESVTERTNSKGETTSLVAFSLDQVIYRNLWSLFGSGLPASQVLRLTVVFALLGALCLAAGLAGTAGQEIRKLDRRSRFFRSAGVFFSLLTMITVPVLILLNNYTFWRKLRLYRDGFLEEGKEHFFKALDDYLFQGGMGEKIETAAGSLDMSHSPAVWLLLVCFFLCFLSAVKLRHGEWKRTLLRTLLYVTIAVVCVVTLYPYYVMLITAFRSNAETLDMYFLHLLPTKWIFGNLKDILDRGVLRYLSNSLIIAGGATALAMLCGIPAAYAMARMDFKGKKAFLGFVIMSQMFSPVVLLIGISQLMNTIHLNDTLLGLVFVNAAFNQAFAVWLLRGTFIAISPEMEQAARIDGCSTVGSLLRILLPMAAPGIVTTLIFVFINSWNEYTISTVLVSTASNRPITVGITQFSSFNMIEWQYLFAASLLATIPVIILFMAIEKHLTSGLTSGGVKG